MKEKFEIVVILEGTVESTGQSGTVLVRCIHYQSCITLTCFWHSNQCKHVHPTFHRRYSGDIALSSWFDIAMIQASSPSTTASSTIPFQWTSHSTVARNFTRTSCTRSDRNDTSTQHRPPHHQPPVRSPLSHMPMDLQLHFSMLWAAGQAFLLRHHHPVNCSPNHNEKGSNFTNNKCRF